MLFGSCTAPLPNKIFATVAAAALFCQITLFQPKRWWPAGEHSDKMSGVDSAESPSRDAPPVDHPSKSLDISARLGMKNENFIRHRGDELIAVA